MVRSMTPEEYARLFNRPVVAELSNNGDVPKPTLGAAMGRWNNHPLATTTPVPNLAEPAPETVELTEEEIELIAQQTVDGYEKKFKKEDWQDADILHLKGHLLERRKEVEDDPEAPKNVTLGMANFSEMGCYKTSTGLWLIEELIKENEVKNPAILIITSKGGKGTFLEAVPEILPDYTILNIETQAIYLYKDKHMLKLSKDVKFVPKEFAMPTVCIAHYNIFAKTNFGKFATDPETGLPLELNGKFLFEPWTQADYIMHREWDIVWTDEFHRLKDRNSKWTSSIKKIPTRIARHGSTGTGFINRPDEIWSLLNFLDKQKYGSYWNFYEEFCEIDDWSGVAKVTGCKPEKRDEFRRIVRDIGVRRTLDEVMPEIQSPIFKPITVELNPAQRRMYDAIRKELEAEDQKGTPLYAANVLSLLQRLRQICVGTPEVVQDYYDPLLDRRVQKIKLTEPSSKLDALMEILEELQWDDERKEPLVVFSCFKDPLELLKARLNKHNEATAGANWEYKYIHLDVGDSDVERYRKWHDEFPKLEHRIFMSTLQLGGESINLTPARHVVFLDRSWSPKDNAQAIGRIRRPGQKNQPVVIHINALRTTDQYIEKVNEVKEGWFTQIFGSENEGT